MLQWLYTYVSSVCSNSFICFRRMLQVFHQDIAKVDLNVAYTYMLQAYVSSVFSCFKRIFQVFHLDVCNGYPRDFLVFQTYVTSVSAVSDVCCKYFI